MVEWLIDDDGYWLTVYTFVQRLPVFLGSLLAGLELRPRGWTYRDYGDGWLCVCLSVCVWIESSESVLILYFFNVDMCSTLLNDWLVTLFFLFVWHLNKVRPTLTHIAVEFLCVFRVLIPTHAQSKPNILYAHFINTEHLTRTCYGSCQRTKAGPALCVMKCCLNICTHTTGSAFHQAGCV